MLMIDAALMGAEIGGQLAAGDDDIADTFIEGGRPKTYRPTVASPSLGKLAETAWKGVTGEGWENPWKPKGSVPWSGGVKLNKGIRHANKVAANIHKSGRLNDGDISAEDAHYIRDVYMTNKPTGKSKKTGEPLDQYLDEILSGLEVGPSGADARSPERARRRKLIESVAKDVENLSAANFNKKYPRPKKPFVPSGLHPGTAIWK